MNIRVKTVKKVVITSASGNIHYEYRSKKDAIKNLEEQISYNEKDFKDRLNQLEVEKNALIQYQTNKLNADKDLLKKLRRLK